VKKQIFDNQLVEQLLVEYKVSKDFNVYQRICMESLNLMDSIIRSNNFYKQAPFHEIRNYLFTQFPRWIENWKQDKSKAYSYWSSCIKNGCISYVGKEANVRHKNVYTDVPLDSIGHEDDVTYSHYHLSDEDLEFLKNKTQEIVCRWREPIIRECLRFTVTAVIQNRADRRQEIIKSITWGYDISPDTAKFLLDWSLGAVRAALLDHYDSPIGEGDMIRLGEKYSFIPDMVNLVGLNNVKKIMVVFAGMTVRFPTTVQIRRGMAAREVYNNKNFTPEGITAVAKKFKISVTKVQESFEEMGANMQAGLTEDDTLFEDKDEDRTKEDRYFMTEFGGEDDFHYNYGD
jgi:hypothetical protein